MSADRIVIAAGAWTSVLLPELAPAIKPIGQPVFHLKVEDPEAFQPPRFPVFGADISTTGWYGFPVHPREGVVKIANHGPGRLVDPSNDPREVNQDQIKSLRSFLQHTFPRLADAPIAGTRLCLYSDTFDGDFWIGRHPRVENLFVASGGSGHAFKFAPVLGQLVADQVEATTASRFSWRGTGPEDSEAARHLL